ncbi:LOW QUALITY PROTEIN: augurin-A [Trematomus bernacchii]|uniref:LOW QUALITY PROTEIN: augurin-A n=1 Tax=Trematomus bernacchii TaxID=40690 RepID=UPI00146AA684|nr:LOW QUALITY PROTEIN: augurin-A [Trematomus bernacchii]
MASQQLCVRLMGLAVLLTLFALRAAGEGAALSRSSLAAPPSTAQGFLSKLSRSKRNLWDRSRPDVQQWIQQFMDMGFDEQRLETDLSYWMDQGRQHQYDENAPIGPRDHSSYRHGADVNYDYY